MTLIADLPSDNEFVRAARKAAITWKASSTALPDHARGPGEYRRWPSLQFVLPRDDATYNLLPEARSVGLQRFAAAGIPWHDGDGSPSNHLLSSQVQCVNALAPFVDRPDALAAIFGTVLPISEVLPFGAGECEGATLSPFDSTDHVVFEWQGLANYLHEWSGAPVRGANATSADAAIRYRTPGGHIEIALIEWKYTEKYPDGKLSTSATSHATRAARYQPLLDRPDCPLDTSRLSLDDLLVEPVYQLMRQALLAHEMELAHELGAEVVRVVYVAPATNHALWASPGSPRFAELASGFGGHLGHTWQSLLRDPSRLVLLDSATLVAQDAPTSTEFKARYGHLAGATAPSRNTRPSRRRFRFRRDALDLDTLITTRDSEGLTEYDLYGEQLQWGYAIPEMYRALARPNEEHVWPPAKRLGIPWTGGYWAPLLHLMLYSLGWANPARGLSWWYSAGTPSRDPHLGLIQDLWHHDGQLDLFAAWLWEGPLSRPDRLPMPGSPAQQAPMWLPPKEWFQVQHRAAADLRDDNPLYGGTDPLHLSSHCTGPLSRPQGQATVTSHRGHATVELPSMVGWYRALHDSDLDEGPVEVRVGTTGRLGIFRRSPITARWHSTTEEIHLVGS